MNLDELHTLYNFTDRTVLVTGGAGVLGAGIAHALMGYHANVVILNRDKEKAEKVIEGFPKEVKGRALRVTGDVLNAETLHQARETVLTEFGAVGVLAHSTHLRGSGVMENGIEKPNVRVTLASQISREDCARLNLGYLDPMKVNVDEWKDREQDDILYVPKAGEILYRLKK